MGLFEQWKELISNQTDESFPEFWEEYSAAEKKIYSAILDDHRNIVSGTFTELKDRFGVSDVLFMGFLDGVSTSLKSEPDLEKITEESAIDLDVDFEKLYFNMLAAGAEHLHQLPEWTSVLSAEEMASIAKAYKKSKTVVKEEQPGRNDPCPCGSGKKYKKCCGA